MHRMGQADAGVDRAVSDVPVLSFAQHHGAGTAITFVAALFGGSQPQVFAQYLQQGAGGGHLAQRDNGVAVDKFKHRVMHGRPN
mgnify:CR=1 FL=1